jgi:hypothetical protein
MTVHGIRTYGSWQERLEQIVSVERREHKIEFVNYKFGYFSMLSFIIPFARWLVVRKFRRELVRLCTSTPRTRIDLVGHSFGTHVIAWAIAGLTISDKFQINTVILAGSVLKSDFAWHRYLGSRIHRVVNDCGSGDSVLLLSQYLVFNTGMAGRRGFIGATGNTLRNRFSEFGHSGYFVDRQKKPINDYLKEYWVPLLD